LGWDSTRDELILASVDGPSIFTGPKQVKLFRLRKGSEPVEFAVIEDAYLYNVHLSPDRKSIAFTAHREGRDNVWLMPAAGGAARRLTANNDSRIFFSSLAWNRDGSSILFGKQSRFSQLSMLTNFK
jgi:dipeptidyl aminopeptidase/acylaminoacyl peptidase